MGSTFRHNKRRNPAFMYEVLVRAMADALISCDQRRMDVLSGILGEHFYPGGVLDDVRELFGVVRETRGVTPDVARRILAEVLRHARLIDRDRLVSEAAGLASSIEESLGREALTRYRIPEYRLLASIQMLTEGYGRRGRISEDVGRIRLEEALVGYMSGRPADLVRHEVAEEVDDLACVLAVQKFEQRYGSELSHGQRALLDECTRRSLSDDPAQVSELLREEKVRLGIALRKSRSMREFTSDEVMAARLDEALARLSRLDERDQEGTVQELMLYRKLEEEIRSDG